jgi:hypothetical protein
MTALALPTLDVQAERLIDLGITDLGDLRAADLRRLAAEAAGLDGFLVLHPGRARPSALAPLLSSSGRPGFVVTDMVDVDDFTPISDVSVPPAAAYVVTGVDRGDEMSGWTPDEALPEILAAGRTPLTLTEGIFWLLQQPDALERNQCFMTIGSRLRRSSGRLDARTPAIWISNGTGRDGPARRHAPKVGWCWAGNRHTWLGFASAAGRAGLPA